MGRHWQYLRYVLRHKWFVFWAGMDLGVDIHRLVLHDWSKFLPSEWFPYARCFYKPDGSKQYEETVEFNMAWNEHQKRHGHHWQRWVLIEDKGTVRAMPMPIEDVLEMISDWIGAGIAIRGRNEVSDWYSRSKDKMLLHEDTRRRVESLLRVGERIAKDGAWWAPATHCK